MNSERFHDNLHQHILSREVQAQKSQYESFLDMNARKGFHVFCCACGVINELASQKICGWGEHEEEIGALWGW